ncbi:hypothetical protein CDAR_287241 [Caerostris darwini]|uniref:Secreted protein n=1 Tax=Caerostris darwini TaxID=1538125 RepID=A0AAV4T1K7_9ARAC|nr:hypothetical protein CDAR_287241 [Caerostris darwini]
MRDVMFRSLLFNVSLSSGVTYHETRCQHRGQKKLLTERDELRTKTASELDRNCYIQHLTTERIMRNYPSLQLCFVPNIFRRFGGGGGEKFLLNAFIIQVAGIKGETKVAFSPHFLALRNDPRQLPFSTK